MRGPEHTIRRIHRISAFIANLEAGKFKVRIFNVCELNIKIAFRNHTKVEKKRMQAFFFVEVALEPPEQNILRIFLKVCDLSEVFDA